MTHAPADWTRAFAAHRPRLVAVARRVLGSAAEAEDAVQDAWLKVSGGDLGVIDNVGAFLTTVVSRTALDHLRRRRVRAPGGVVAAEAAAGDDVVGDLLLAESLAPALLMVLERLGPAERVAFVLHDVFDLPFDEIAPILGRSVVATRQIASRARRRVRGRAAAVPDVDADADADADVANAEASVVDAFLKASRDGDFDALCAVLDDHVVLKVDADAAAAADRNGWGRLPREQRGQADVATTLRGRARGLTRADVDGDAAAVWSVDGVVRSAFLFSVVDGRIAEIELVMEPARLHAFAIALAGR